MAQVVAVLAFVIIHTTFLAAQDDETGGLKIILAPSFGRGRRAKRGGVGFLECGSTVSRGQPPPLRGTSFQRKEGEKRAACIVIGIFAAKPTPSLPLNLIAFPSRGRCPAGADRAAAV